MEKINAKSVINNAAQYIEQAYLSSINKTLDKESGIKNVYYVGGTLCIDIGDDNKIAYTLMLNISDESVAVEPINGNEGLNFNRRLLDLTSLNKAFRIYQNTKGQTKYWMDCFNKSCIRHFLQV